MIIGLGSDIVDVRRIKDVLDRHGDRFLDRCFTPVERAKADRRARRVETYAKRFAAKEACSKALGTGLAHGEPGSLAQITQVIAEHDGNIDNIRMTRRAPDFTDVDIDLEVYDLKHLNAIIAQLRAKTIVAKAERVNG